MPTHFTGTATAVRALNTFIKLMRATDAVNAHLAPPLALAGLTTGQLGILEALLFLGPMRQCALAAKLLRSTSNVTTILDNLEKRGLVARQRRQDDRRVIDVSLTRAGRRLIDREFPAHAARIAEALAVLSPAEQQLLGALCKKLGTSFAPSH
jgi:MarR family 2-MHQ and catechol resistance regulon transcriptional repressor